MIIIVKSIKYSTGKYKQINTINSENIKRKYLKKFTRRFLKLNKFDDQKILRKNWNFIEKIIRNIKKIFLT